MKKSGWIIISFLILFTFTSEAQIDWGVRVGAARSSLTQKVDGMFRSKGRFGFSVAGIADISLKNRWTLRPEVAFVHEGGGYVSNWTFSGVNLLENKYKYYSLQVPINVAYNIPLSDVTLSIAAGPVLDFSLFGKMNTQTDKLENINFWSTSREKDLKPFDMGVNVSLSVEYVNVFFSIGTVFGTLDRRAVKREGESAVFQNNVNFSIGYFFRDSKRK